MFQIIQRYVVPGLVIQAVLVGGGYATGRELVEFFVSMGPAAALIGMGLTAVLFSASAMIAFELARRFRAYDYNSFMGILLGRLCILFEIGYLASLVLVLAVVSAAAGELMLELAGWPLWLSAVIFMAIVAALVFFGNSFVERLISAWSILFYATYLLLFVLVVMRFGDDLSAALAAAPVKPKATLWNGLSYMAYNIPLLPVLIFVARNFASRREAFVAGALAGPLILLPGFAFLMTLSSFYPEIADSTLPVQFVLDRLGHPVIALMIQFVIIGALVKTGVGLLHGFNERIARAAADHSTPLPAVVRPLVALVVMVVAIFAATAVGLVDLIGQGYRYSAAYFLAVLVIPLFTVGLWRLKAADKIERGA